MYSPMHLLGKAIWLITALASITLGLMPLGYNLFMYVPMSLMAAIHYAIGVAGLISLALMIKACACCETGRCSSN